MSEHPNVTLLKEGYAAFAKQDMDTIDRFYDDDVLIHIPGRSQLAGDYRGKDEVFGFYAKLFELAEGNYRIEPYAYLANDEYAVALVVESGERKGRTVRLQGAQAFRIVDGRVTEGWGFGQDLYAFDEFWS